MLNTARINEIVHEVANENLPHESVDHVESADAIDSEGREAVRIVISLKPDTLANVDGDAVLDTLVGIQIKLSAAGEERLPIVEYALLGEVESDGDA
jgi:hypothetical protein